ncbi:expressed unknown protein [Seminavis robusta]|uniref:Uncharacterized protein n=1 Tax=Seminavis robusta TaxID=568900 RepID=A0A9N8E2X0_9STRA|nr:expressed unknown protein [Seminavis robusta]|eukprot:Sro472_g149830.1 n/a (252) ;mRNA; f:3425-4180
MNLEQQASTAPVASVAELPPIEYLNFSSSIMPPTASVSDRHNNVDDNNHDRRRSNPFRHSTGTMDTSIGSSYNNHNTMEMSISDLKQRRRSKFLEDSSNMTATTVNSSYNNQSSSLFGGSFSHHQLHRASNSTMDDDTSDCSSLKQRPRAYSSVSFTDSLLDDSSGISLGSSGRRTRELRNLKGIRRRRSDPVTRRWREQCSKLYKEHVLDSCPEQQIPPLTTPQQVLAAIKIQSWFRRRGQCQRQRLLQA